MGSRRYQCSNMGVRIGLKQKSTKGEMTGHRQSLFRQLQHVHYMVMEQMEKKEKNEKNATHTIQMKALWIVSTSRLNVYQD